jgi:hypothetical protein
MLILKIKKPGLMVSIPGVPSFRSPADLDISKLDLKMLIGYLKSNSISDYEIHSASDTGKVDVFKEEDFDAVEKKKSKKEYDIETRFKQLEKMLSFLVEKATGNNQTDSEQITKKLERLESLIGAIPKDNTIIIHKLGDPKIESLREEEIDDAYIPDIDISDMKMSSGSYKEIENKGKKAANESADLLAGLLFKK